MSIEKLTLQNKMANSWLIQGLEKPFKNPSDPLADINFGVETILIPNKVMELIKPIFRFEYMGASEFEWGAIPSALRFLAEQAGGNNLVTGKLIFDIPPLKNKVHSILNDKLTVYYLTPKHYETEVIERIKLLKDDKIRLLEHCCLSDYFSPYEIFRKCLNKSDNVGWLELDNGFMFFVDKVMFNNTCNIFGVK